MASLLQKKWHIKTPHSNLPLLDRVTKHRSLDLENELQDLHSPWLMKDMKKAVERIAHAIRSQEPIMIFGDYDVDGVCGASILYLGLQELGADVSVRLPHRERDGYGLSMKVIDECAELGAKVLITVDCGISAVGPVDYALSKGIDIIVTDHHSIPAQLPRAFAILNPKQVDCEYPEKEIVGTVVAFKLLCALMTEASENVFFESFRRRAESRPELVEGRIEASVRSGGRVAAPSRQKTFSEASSAISKYLDLAALATVADCAPLRGENRLIVKLGLKQLRNTKHRGLRKLLESYQLIPASSFQLLPSNLRPNSYALSSYDLAFKIAPCINAAGRLEDPMIAFEMMMGNEERAMELRALNMERQQALGTALEEAMTIVEKDDQHSPILIVHSELWQPGIIGLIAGRLTERFDKPTICLARVGEKLVGSCRSVSDINIVEWLGRYNELFISFGGHAQAAGLSIDPGKLPELKERFQQDLKALRSENPREPELMIDTELSPKEMTLENIHGISLLEPFGMGNPKPKFLLQNMKVLETRMVGADGKHLQLKLFDGKRIHKGIAFQFAEHAKTIQSWEHIDLVCQLNKNEWNGKVSVDVQMLDARQSGLEH